MITCKDTDECFDIFATKYDKIFNKCVPLTRMSIKRCNDKKKWMTKGIRNSIMIKTILYKKYINTTNDNNKTVHRKHTRKYTIVIYSSMESILPGSYRKFTQNLLIRVKGILPMLKSCLSMTLT